MSTSTKSIIEDLLEKPFSKRSLAEKRLIVENGRPCPKLSSLKSVHKDSKKEYTRNFKESQYNLYPWLAGCEKQVKLFCWPCLLFSRVKSAWNSTGLENLNTLQTLQKKHKQSISHLQSVLMLASFGQNADDEALGMKLKMLNSQHNLQVKKNREVLKRLIDVTCFLAKQELPFTGQDESANSPNRGNYVELLNLIKQYDPALEEHFQSATATFKSTSMTIQNDLIKAIGKVLDSHICKQLELSEFVAIVLDESSDILKESQLSVVLRYCLKDKIYETFVGFVDMSSGRSADDLLTFINTILQKYDITRKIVAQTYDRTALMMSDELNDLQTKVRDLCPNALFVHWYAHVLNLVLPKGLDNIRKCKIFFNTLNDIANFGSHHSKDTYSLKEYLKQEWGISLVKTKGCFNSRLVNLVDTFRDDILEYFYSIQKDDDFVWESTDRMAAAGYSEFLKSFETVFLLNVFTRLFTHSDLLSDTLQNEISLYHYCIQLINKFDIFLRYQKKYGFSEVWRSITSQPRIVSIKTVKSEQFDSDDDEIQYKKIFSDILDNLIMQVSERFTSFIEQLKYFELLNGMFFTLYTRKFPEDLLKNLTESYPDTFDYNQLKNELTVLYASSNDIKRHMATKFMESQGTARINRNYDYITPYDVLQYIDNKDIAASFEQVYKLSKLICTIPVTYASVERSFSPVDRIKTYLGNTRGQERLSCLPLLSIEKALLTELQNSDDFYDRVIESFLAVDYRAEFMYKQHTFPY